jgi:predicted nucleotidyltransferase
MTQPTPYTALNEVLGELVAGIRENIGEDFIGAYLQGSFALGDFDVHSDVDFIVVIKEELSFQQVENLQRMHGQVYNLESRWAQHLEGSYFPMHILRQHTTLDDELWYLDNGARSLIKSRHCNTALVRWVIRENGVILEGPPPRSLIDPISVETLRRGIREVITGWGQEILMKPEKYNNRFYQTFIVLSYCRMLNDLYNGYPGTKVEGAEWAKENLDPSWSPLIDRTWAGRPKPEISVRQPADPGDFADTLRFIRYIIDIVQGKIPLETE